MKEFMLKLWNDERRFALVLRALVMALAASLPLLPLPPHWAAWITPIVAGLAMLIPSGSAEEKK